MCMTFCSMLHVQIPILLMSMRRSDDLGCAFMVAEWRVLHGFLLRWG